ncbi:MAG TPA: Sua5/YciO/YrdC/YwlC family protein [Deltaproteobacteria bacterium]|nr:Sua5/YciO/YrdC/YwlC family protein [Deltaproteobacteria bacterium]
MTIGRSIEKAVARLAADGFVAYPTETVWGLGACADRPVAIERLRAWKGRRGDSPLAVLVASVEAAIDLGCSFDPTAMRLARSFWPGPLMLIVPCARSWAPGVARTDGALGLRCSSHALARSLVEATEAAGLGPLTTTSLNRSGSPPTTRSAEARALAAARPGRDLESPFLLAAGEVDAGGAVPSSIVDCTGVEPRILRVGALDRAVLEAAWMHPACRRPEATPSDRIEGERIP